MDRRDFLTSMTAAGLAGLSVPLRPAFAASDVLPAGSVNRVAIIGAGIVGASIAYNLSKRGCDVILIEKHEPAAQASGNSFAWINASYFDMPQSYFALRTLSLNEYHRLAADVDIPIRWGGSLEWYHSDDREREVVDGVRHIQGYGAPVWMIGADRVAELEPNLRLPGNRQVAWCSRDAAIHPGDTTHALVGRVIENGGTTLFPATVTGVLKRQAKMLVETDVETFEVDQVVVAAGTGANEIAAMLELGTDLIKAPTPGIIVTTRPMPPLINSVAYTTDTHFHQLNDGRVILGEKAGPPETDQHLAYLTERPNAYASAELAMQHANRVIEIAKKYVPEFSDAEIESVGVGWRPLPLDGLPVIGRPKKLPEIYLASMHSGVTLAPIVGHLAAMEILDGVSVNLLADFRVERF
ncbi:MAG: FAD-dependent oxidoreductase [Proteobacteria bacterium]|nr:FAD-dependent oxidoreductase [Pseudomonadota bacterium]MDA0993002.1 FAD-dependent oxidoreductase [Pseudomonadota bacterium]